MAMFRRRSAPVDSESGPTEEPVDLDVDVDGSELGEQPEAAFDRTAGPFDEAESDQADQDLPRLDLGALRIPGLPGVGVQVEADPNTQEVRAITGVGKDAAVQLQVFAAPRSEGVWDEVRAEMVAEIGSTAGARVTEVDGAFGHELRAIVPARTPEGKQVRQPLRFCGIDGPRWFLRVVFLGDAAVEPDPADELHTLVRQTIVVRGTEPMAPRDPLPLRLPQQPPAGMAAAGQDAGEGEADSSELDEESAPDDEPASRFGGLDPFERGPEITEVR